VFTLNDARGSSDSQASFDVLILAAPRFKADLEAAIAINLSLNGYVTFF
jgi:hypothetical protein